MEKLPDLTFSAEHQDVRLIDVFLPGANANSACIFFVHGGGWAGGSRQAWHPVMEHYCELGYVCTSADYRLVPDWQFPAPVEDLRIAMSFVKEHAAEWSFETTRVGAWGSSSGAHLAALLATIRPEDELGMSAEVRIRDTVPNALVCLCGVLTVHRYESHDGVPKMLDNFMGVSEDEDPERYRLGSPIDLVCGKEPPFLMIVGDEDRTTPAGLHEQMRDALTGKGVSAELVILPGVGHGFGYGVQSDAQKETLKITEPFIEKALLG